MPPACSPQSRLARECPRCTEPVYSSQSFLSSGDHFRDASRICDIGNDPVCCALLIPDQFSGVVGRSLIPIHHDDMSPLSGKEDCEGSAIADGLIFQLKIGLTSAYNHNSPADHTAAPGAIPSASLGRAAQPSISPNLTSQPQEPVPARCCRTPVERKQVARLPRNEPGGNDHVAVAAAARSSWAF